MDRLVSALVVAGGLWAFWVIPAATFRRPYPSAPPLALESASPPGEQDVWQGAVNLTALIQELEFRSPRTAQRPGVAAAFAREFELVSRWNVELDRLLASPRPRPLTDCGPGSPGVSAHWMGRAHDELTPLLEYAHALEQAHSPRVALAGERLCPHEETRRWGEGARRDADARLTEHEARLPAELRRRLAAARAGPRLIGRPSLFYGRDPRAAAEPPRAVLGGLRATAWRLEQLAVYAGRARAARRVDELAWARERIEDELRQARVWEQWARMESARRNASRVELAQAAKRLGLAVILAGRAKD